MLIIIETHPIQYKVPVYRELANSFHVPLTVIYGSDHSVVGYYDKGFGASFKWDVDLLSGYDHIFNKNCDVGSAFSPENLSSEGMRENIEKLNPKAVMISGYSPSFHLDSFKICRQKKLPILFRGEVSDLSNVRGSFVRSFLRDLWLMNFYRQCSTLLSIGEGSKRHYRRLAVSEDKIIESPYFIGAESFKLGEKNRNTLRNQTRAKLNIHKDQKVLLFSGKLEDKKNPQIIVEALKRMTSDLDKDVCAVYLGDGKLRGEIENLAKKAPSVNIKVLGFKNQTDLSAYYYASDILVLPSLYDETWGLVVNEGLMHGLPFVISDTVGSGPSLLEEGVTGEIFKAGCIDGLANSIEKVISWEDSVETREKRRAKIARFNAFNAAKGISEAYQKVRLK